MSQSDRERWDARFRAGSHASTEPSAFLQSLDELLPTEGRALDVAGGAGRNALWLARRGLEVTIADVSPVGLSIAADRARAEGLALRTLAIDLQTEPLPAGPWDLIVSVCFLERSLFSAYPEALAPGGLLVFLQPTTTNLERHAKPPRSFLLEPGEAADLVADLEVVQLTEGWTEDGHHEARVVARRPHLGFGGPSSKSSSS